MPCVTVKKHDYIGLLSVEQTNILKVTRYFYITIVPRVTVKRHEYIGLLTVIQTLTF
jgi:hypothetical protein